MGFYKSVTTSATLFMALMWWEDADNLYQGCLIIPPCSTYIVTTGTSIQSTEAIRGRFTIDSSLSRPLVGTGEDIAHLMSST